MFSQNAADYGQGIYINKLLKAGSGLAWAKASLRRHGQRRRVRSLELLGDLERFGGLLSLVLSRMTSSRLRTSPSVSTTLFWSGCCCVDPTPWMVPPSIPPSIRLSLCISYGLDCCWLFDVLWDTRDYWCYFWTGPGNRFKTWCRLANHRYIVQFGHTTFRAAVHLYSFINLFRPLNKIDGDFTYLFVLYESSQLLFL